MTWLLDTNIFIQAARREYGFDFCPAFWDWLTEANTAGRVCSLDRVLSELVPGDDVADWAHARPEGFFLPVLPTDLPFLGRVSDWARSGEYTAAAAHQFMSVADSFLVAVALSRRLTIVTHETPSNSRSRIKIPNACIELGVRYASPFEMLRRERARFVLRR